jgi:hypothetical protein
METIKSAPETIDSQLKGVGAEVSDIKSSQQGPCSLSYLFLSIDQDNLVQSSNNMYVNKHLQKKVPTYQQ